MSKNVLVTGAAGFIGRYVVRYFAKNGWSVAGVDMAEPENAPQADLHSYHSLRLPSDEFLNILQRQPPDVCIHCAGRASIGLSISDPYPDFYDSVVLTFEVLNGLRKYAGNCRFILLSSAAVYGNPAQFPVDETCPAAPISPYGFHKLHCEELCREFNQVYKLPTAVVRIFSAYGSGLRRQVIWDICYKALTQKKVVLHGTGKESRDFIHAADIAGALMQLARNAPMENDIYNLASGKEMSIDALADMIMTNLKSNCVVEFDGRVPDGTPLNWAADISKIKQAGFSSMIDFNEGLKSVVDWCRAELKI